MAANLRQSGTVVSEKLLYRWLREADIDRRALGSLDRLGCPFPAPRIQELYRLEEKTVREIAAPASPLLGREKPVSGPTVGGWLRGAGITLRTNTEARRPRTHLLPVRVLVKWTDADKADVLPFLTGCPSAATVCATTPFLLE